MKKINNSLKTILFLLSTYSVIIILLFYLTIDAEQKKNILLQFRMETTLSSILEILFNNQDINTISKDVTGFGIYDDKGSANYQYGTAPDLIDKTSITKRQIILYDKDQNKITLIRKMRPMPMRHKPMHMRMRRPAFPFSSYLFIEVTGDNYFSSVEQITYTRIFTLFIITILYTSLYYAFLKNKEYQRKIKKQEQLVVLGTAARTFSHEIKNPLSAIRLQTGLLKKITKKNTAESLKIIEEEVDRLNSLSDKITFFLKDPIGKLETIELKKFINNLIKRFNNSIRFQTNSQETFYVEFDKERLRSVLENLIKNAIESQNTEEPITISLSKSKASIQLSIYDKGKGITKQELNRLFDPFFTTKAKGSGIGLFISKRFIEACDGNLTLQNKKDEGVEAKIILKEKKT